MTKLTDKQRAFALEYIIDLNATKAAERAGYAKKTAYSQGQRLLKHVEVEKLIAELMQEKEDALIAKSDEVLRYLTRVMRREESENTVVVLKGGESKWVTGPDGKPKKVTETWEEEKIVEFPTKVSDANRAAEMLGRRYAMFTDNKSIDISGAVEFVDDISGGEDE